MDYLHAGDLAYYDSAFSGLIPCRVLSISADSEQPTSAVDCTVELTAVRPGYARGEQLDVWSLHVIHRRHVHRHRRSFSTIGYGYGFKAGADMTLAQYLMQYDSVVTVQPYGADQQAIQLFLAARATLDARWDAFHLSDYVVSSTASGPSYILVPRDG